MLCFISLDVMQPLGMCPKPDICMKPTKLLKKPARQWSVSFFSEILLAFSLFWIVSSREQNDSFLSFWLIAVNT